MARTAFSWLNAESRAYLSQDYLLPGVTPEQRIRHIGDTAERILRRSGFSDRFFDYMSRGWYSLASPIWSNFGLERGLPISCFGCSIDDSMKSILSTHAEIGMMSKYGGGTSAYLGRVRGCGSPITDNGASHGSVEFAEMFDVAVRKINQGSTRRGECALWWPIDHPDIDDVLTIRTPGSPFKKITYGVCVTDRWMEDMIAGDKRKRDVWAKVLENRKFTGFPYLFFTDNVNRQAPAEYKKLGLSIDHSNLCTEICLSNNSVESFVCCLSSMNDLYVDEWAQVDDAVEVLVYLLDAVMSEFIDRARGKYGMERAVRFAERQRALGLGQLGWHSYLQSRMIPFESMEAVRETVRITKLVRDRAYAASAKMAAEYGEPEYLKGSGRRHMTLNAIAPTKSSSTILGQVSEGIEPYTTNYTIKDNQKGKISLRNPFLGALIAEKGVDPEAAWQEVLKSGGSVQRVAWLSEAEKKVFKTFVEISQMDVIVQAAARQPYIDQGQSVNVMIDPSVPTREVNALYIEAWKLGLKTLYYQKNVNAAQELSRSILTCSACES